MLDELFKLYTKIKNYIISLSPRAIKQDTEKILDLIAEYIECSPMEEIREAKAALAKERNLRSAVLDHLDDMVWAKDLDGKYIMTNKSFRENFCYDLTDVEILGKSDMELAAIFKNKVGDENHTFGDVCGNSDLVVQEVQEALKFLETGNINGKIMKLVVNKSPLANNKGEIFGTCGSGRDVTEWHTDLEIAIKSSNACFGSDATSLLLKELNKLEFK